MRMRAVVALLALTTMSLAGCASGDDDQASINQSPKGKIGGAIGSTGYLPDINGTLYSLSEAETPVELQRFLGTSTFEPTIGSDADGCLYFTHYQGTGTGTRIMKSCDQGATWTDIGPNLIKDGPQGDEPCFRNSNDPFVHVDADTGRVFSSDLHLLITSTLHFTDDKGDSWTCNPIGAGLPPGVHDHQSITTAKARGDIQPVGYENMVYYCVNRVADSWCSSSYDGGLGFGPAITVFTGVPPRGNPTSIADNVCGGLTGHVETDREGRVYLPRSYCGIAQVGVSDDDGLTWTQVIIDETTGVQGHEVRIAADEANNLYAFWIGADYMPYIATSVDHGLTWADPIMVANEGVTGAARPAIAAGADGSIVLAYIGFENDEGRQTPPEAMEWFAYLGVIYNAMDPIPTIFPAKMSETPIDMGRDCGTDRCGGIGDFIDVTIDPEGRPWAAFADQCMGTTECGQNHAFAGTLDTGRSMTSTNLLASLVSTAELPVEVDS